MDSPNRNSDLALRLDTDTRARLLRAYLTRSSHYHSHRLANNWQKTNIAPYATSSLVEG